MIVELPAKVLAVIPKNFSDRVSGEPVEYNESWFLTVTEDGVKDVIKFNTKADLSDKEGANVVIRVEVDASGKQKPKLLGLV